MRAILLIVLLLTAFPAQGRGLRMAVEFTDHAACAYIALQKGWFQQEGLDIEAYETYVTGMALAAALARGDTQVAYLCLVPALNLYANARVPVKIVAGTHRYGYGLVADPKKIKTPRDLGKPGLRIGCVREGGAVDVMLRRTMEVYGLTEEILKRVRRMPPPKQLLALRAGQLDAAFLPEHWISMAEEMGFRVILRAQDVWPEMQGSVLVVKEELLQKNPQLVRTLVRVSQRATAWIGEHPEEAARIMARVLSVADGKTTLGGPPGLTPRVISRSMARMQYTTAIDPQVVQGTIDYMVHLGYIRKSFRAREILDLRFLR